MPAERESCESTDASVKEARARYADFFEFAPVGYLVLAADGQIIEINRTGVSLLGFAAAAQMPAFSAFVAPDAAERWNSFFINLMRYDPHDGLELALRRSNGTVFQARIDCLRRQTENGDVQVRLTLSNISELKRTEASLREKEARFRFIIDKSPGLIWVADADKRSIWFNKTWLAFTGRTIHQELGQGWVDVVHPGDYAECRPVVDGLFDARQPFSVEYRLRRHDGEYRWMLGIGQPRFDERGGFQGYVGTCLDITERKRAEVEREQLLAFFTLSLDMMCVAGPRGYFEKVNPAFVQISGYSEKELLETPFLDFVVDEDRTRIQGEVEMARLRGGNCCFEMRFRRKDGSARFFSWQIHSDTQLGVLYGTGRDLTDLRVAEDQLSMLWLAVQQSSQSIVISDLSGRVEYANEASCSISGYPAAEMVGNNQRVLHSGLTPAETYAEMWATLKRGEVWQGEFINARKNGEIYIESARISPVRQPDGRITHYLAIKEDITEHKRTMDAIRESKTLLQGVVDAIPDWIYVKDSEHRFLLVNEQCAKTFGQTPSSVIGRYDYEFIPSSLRFGSPEAGTDGVHEDDDAVFAGESIHRPYDKAYFKNGEVRVFDTYKRPMRDSSLRITGNLCYRRDITERFNKQQEQELLERQLRQAQKMELIGHLTGGIAHDFNNILAAVFGYAELMQMSPDVEKSPQLGGCPGDPASGHSSQGTGCSAFDLQPPQGSGERIHSRHANRERGGKALALDHALINFNRLRTGRPAA